VLAGLGCSGRRTAAGKVEGLQADFAELGCEAATTLAGCERSWAWGAGLDRKEEKESGGRWETFSNFQKTTQTNEFKQRFEFKHSKQFTSMYATGNSYIPSIN
jgi:hypothetical protein